MLRFSDSELGALTVREAVLLDFLKLFLVRFQSSRMRATSQTSNDKGLFSKRLERPVLVQIFEKALFTIFFSDFGQFMYCYKQDGKAVPKTELFQVDS